MKMYIILSYLSTGHAFFSGLCPDVACNQNITVVSALSKEEQWQTHPCDKSLPLFNVTTDRGIRMSTSTGKIYIDPLYMNVTLMNDCERYLMNTGTIPIIKTSGNIDANDTSDRRRLNIWSKIINNAASVGWCNLHNQC